MLQRPARVPQRIFVWTSRLVLLTAGAPLRSSTLRTRRARPRRAHPSGLARAHALAVLCGSSAWTCAAWHHKLCGRRWALHERSGRPAGRRVTLRHWMPHRPCDLRDPPPRPERRARAAGTVASTARPASSSASSPASGSATGAPPARPHASSCTWCCPARDRARARRAVPPPCTPSARCRLCAHVWRQA